MRNIGPKARILSSIEMLVRAKIIVKGVVQGVGFRAFVKRKAESLGLTGWVRNLPDGESVEAVVEGPKDKIAELVKHMLIGPPAADVVSAEVRFEKATGEFKEFIIRY